MYTILVNLEIVLISLLHLEHFNARCVMQLTAFSLEFVTTS